MEESEKRRERLRAMRMEANTPATLTTSSSQQTILNTPLSNPLLDTNNTSEQSLTARPRFDFYTDPMAAYSSDKRLPSFSPRPHFSPSTNGPRNPEMPFSGVHQFQNSSAPHQSYHQGGDPYSSHRPAASPMGVRSPYPMYQSGDPSYGPDPTSSPMAVRSPYPMYQGGDSSYGPGPTSSPMGVRSPYPVHQGGDPSYFPASASSPMGVGSPYPVHQGSPSFSSGPGRGHWCNNSLSPGSGHGGSPYPVHQGIPNFRSLQGRGSWFNNSPSPGPGRGGDPKFSVGRGRGRQDCSNISPGSGYSGGRGRGYNYDAQHRSFYQRSMVEDPWASLTPVLWQGEYTGRSVSNNQGSVQMTPSAKKARVSNTSNSSSSKPSLAEFLAAAYDEAVGDDKPVGDDAAAV